MLHKSPYYVTADEFDALSEQIEDMPIYTQMLILICQYFDKYELMNHFAEYQPEKGSLLHDFHDLVAELGFSFSNDALYAVMAGTHPLYHTIEDEADDGENTNITDFDSNDTDEAYSEAA